jgi:hypothetical protein
MRKVYVEVVTRLIIEMDGGIEVGDVIADMDYDFDSRNDGADVIDTEIINYEVKDSK